MFMCPETTVAMRWHDSERPNDGNIRHPADGETWNDFYSMHPNFSKDPRNVRLGLSSDGFNPFRIMSISHSTWLVMLMNYNLSSWICMRPEYMMLSMIIQGSSSPGQDIDVYLQPLITELKELCKVLRRADLELMQIEIKEIVYELEKIFPPSFFNIMEHLPIHLGDEIILGGPNHLRWMYSNERKMCEFKGFVRNRRYPEGYITEGFDVEEFLIFEGDDLSLSFPKLGHPDGNGKEKKGNTFTMDLELSSEVHQYVLFNTGDEQVEDFIKVTLSATTDSFASAQDQNPIDGEVIYYGAIQDIIEVDYYNCFSVVLFRCDWFHNEIDEYGLTRVYFNKSRSTDDTFVLASQVHQVFYVADLIEKDVYYARNKVPVDLYDLEEENCPNIGVTFWRELSEDIGPSDRLFDVGMRWSREDIPVDVVDIPSDAQFSKDTTM
ncbi:hypothetical protein MTR67_043188 [Solanum verrucosum]|uniref:DUF4216 domain-containing protein n=1 Tax=Solanum verrucosum TaxID=315347 RepID=A0AAF0ZU21_SOLVR|nr:hypothetical protein MTR67_043188 [Solanum verrucosum]